MILFFSNADTELLALRSVVDDLSAELGEIRWLHPDRTTTLPSLRTVDIVVVRLLGGRRSWEEPFDALRAACLAQGVPLVASGGEAALDAELTAASTAPAGVVGEAHRYLVAGGPRNLGNLLRFLSDTLLLTGFGFDQPRDIPNVGVWDGAGLGRPGATPRRPPASGGGGVLSRPSRGGEYDVSRSALRGNRNCRRGCLGVVHVLAASRCERRGTRVVTVPRLRRRRGDHLDSCRRRVEQRRRWMARPCARRVGRAGLAEPVLESVSRGMGRGQHRTRPARRRERCRDPRVRRSHRRSDIRVQGSCRGDRARRE